MSRAFGILCVALVAAAGCVTPTAPPPSIRTLPPETPRQIVVVAAGETTFSVMHDGNLEFDPALDNVLKWIPYASIWRGVAQLVQWGVNSLSEVDRRASTEPHVRGLRPRAVVAEAFAQTLVASGRIREVRTLDREPVGDDRRASELIVRLAVPSWGLTRVREGKPDLVAAFADVRAQVVVPETGVILWEHEEDVTHPERLPLEAFRQDRPFTRERMVDVLERAGRRLASEYLYARSAGR
jgi:hypothetical protein